MGEGGVTGSATVDEDELEDEVDEARDEAASIAIEGMTVEVGLKTAAVGESDDEVDRVIASAVTATTGVG